MVGLKEVLASEMKATVTLRDRVKFYSKSQVDLMLPTDAPNSGGTNQQGVKVGLHLHWVQLATDANLDAVLICHITSIVSISLQHLNVKLRFFTPKAKHLVIV